MSHYIVDEMKKEGKVWRNLMIFGYVLSILMPLGICVTNKPGYLNGDAIKSGVIFFLYGSLGLYGWLYAIKYRLEITKDRIVITTCFGKKELGIREITAYSYKRYHKSVFYGFTLRTQRKNIVVYTRYWEAFAEVLKQNGIAKAD